ncbi:gamma-glutamyltransferase [Devosia yakushimensis]|uniref:Gamma-glutamyltransferase n=1 Tax=Devosia yakushimensis TaxID=470028 RepID=A0ABQ5UJ93_9HYPH|nr:gamma-glutamyltransferase family protein [Devosia yakushimensis]GLQ12113.1 gamma-glutamyltransferase [Devosia yakushimensis]
MNYAFPYPSRRAPVMAQNVVATSQPLASQAGLDALAKGGNAVDAALASAITLTVVEPTGNGLGSDAFAIIWDGTSLHGLNASGRSPAAWTPDRFAGLQSMPRRGWESVTVPGAVSAWMELSKKFGKLPFTELFESALRYAKNGFLVTPTIAKLWKQGASELSGFPGFAETFMPSGKAPAVGTQFRNPAIASSLSLIARSGGEAFYQGELAQKIVEAAAQNGAALNAADLADHQAEWCGTISTRFHGTECHEIPPAGQGIAALMAMGIVEHLEIGTLDPDGPEAIHLQIEAVKLAYADLKKYVGDLSAMRITSKDLLDPDYLRSRASLVDRHRAQDLGAGAPKHGGTVYLATADASGMMVSYIQSNYVGFGSGVVVPETGIHLQNRGFGFTLEQGHPNLVGPRKRPFHTIIPGFLLKDGLPEMSFGVMGGPMQAQGHLQMIVRTQVFGQNAQAASDAPRWRFTAGLDVACEGTMSTATVAGLDAMGHRVTVEEPDQTFGFGGAQLIQRIDGGYVGASDHRRDGMAVGY